ncbi:MAG: transglutaminase family protein [Myxococcales bacterium]|nr:transglutaminase family protein [Myxococcales bacterium]
MSIDRASLEPTWFLDADHPALIAFAEANGAGLRARPPSAASRGESGLLDGAAAIEREATTVRAAAISLFYAVRDGIRYNPYNAARASEQFKASSVLARGEDFCVPKAILLAAAARALGIPARLGFADVRNHLATPRLLALMRSDVFAFHGFTLLWLDRRWVKVAPTFNRSLCDRMGVATTEFDGVHDAMLQPFDPAGRQYMEYLHQYGAFDDFPLELMLEAWRRAYPHFFVDGGAALPTGGSLETD